jgi:hypothetical protein
MILPNRFVVPCCTLKRPCMSHSFGPTDWSVKLTATPAVGLNCRALCRIEGITPRVRTPWIPRAAARSATKGAETSLRAGAVSPNASTNPNLPGPTRRWASNLSTVSIICRRRILSTLWRESPGRSRPDKIAETCSNPRPIPCSVSQLGAWRE